MPALRPGRGGRNTPASFCGHTLSPCGSLSLAEATEQGKLGNEVHWGKLPGAEQQGIGVEGGGAWTDEGGRRRR